MDRIRSDLPRDLLEPTVTAERADGESVLTYAVQRDGMDEQALSWFVDDTSRKRFCESPVSNGSNASEA